jgi:hypothetical protein
MDSILAIDAFNILAVDLLAAERLYPRLFRLNYTCMGSMSILRLSRSMQLLAKFSHSSWLLLSIKWYIAAIAQSVFETD